MSSFLIKPEKGIVYTFYSFKGGVGRTMALANVAALLAKWERSVLIVDWDLEAPGLKRFFFPDAAEATAMRSSKPGIVDLVTAHRDGETIDWTNCLHSRRINGTSASVSIITAGREDGEYTNRLQSIDFSDLFAHKNLGAYIEDLRDAWTAQFDFVLIDSRTGVTDIGGICTVHLADVLVLLFTSTDSSTKGAKDIIERARKAQSFFPVDRSRLLAVPVPSRDESRTEYERAAQWKRIYAEEFGSFYADWLPSGIAPIDAVETLRIPYVPYWSFGERLPVIEEGTNSPGTLGYSYQILARLLLTRLNWYEALDGQTTAPPPVNPIEQIDPAWLENHRELARLGLKRAGGHGFMEISHHCRNVRVSADQSALLAAAKQAEVRTSGWPLGLVLDTLEDRPRPDKDGIVAAVSSPDFFNFKTYDYWACSNTGSFYALSSFLAEEDANQFMDGTRTIARTAEALLHCANLYRALGVGLGAEIELTVQYEGLKGRKLRRHHGLSPWIGAPLSISRLEMTNYLEDKYSAKVRFRLSSLDSELLDLTVSLCKGLFMLFDFATFAHSAYATVISGFLAGRPV
jgi:cellulose biosynthesis protein BcsQ